MAPSTEPFDDMPVLDKHVPGERYRAFLESMPQVCVEVVLETERGILLAKRVNHPEVWFWPGSRLYKGEPVRAAVTRVAKEELGIAVDIREPLGVYAHFWEAAGGEPSRHTVNLPYRAVPADPPVEISLDDQHEDYRFVTQVEGWMHEYVRQYLTDGNLV
ncbi:MAG: NUDIX domain-containing protein [Salinirussus sp.]